MAAWLGSTSGRYSCSAAAPMEGDEATLAVTGGALISDIAPMGRVARCSAEASHAVKATQAITLIRASAATLATGRRETVEVMSWSSTMGSLQGGRDRPWVAARARTVQAFFRGLGAHRPWSDGGPFGHV